MPAAGGCGPQVGNSIIVNVTAGNGDYLVPSNQLITPTLTGTYFWKAVYSGDSPNTLGQSDDDSCTESTEQVVVTGHASIASAQNWLPNDTVTLTTDATGGTTLNGTLTITLYNDGACGAAGGNVVVAQGLTNPETHTVASAGTGSTFSTNNTTFKVMASGSYSWLVSYHDNILNSPPAHCETSSLVIQN
jgi:hypothetical protein